MDNSKLNEAKKDQNEKEKSKGGLSRNFPGFAQILQWQVESNCITLEELEENMQRQSALTLRPHDQVIKEILEGVEWTEEE